MGGGLEMKGLIGGALIVWGITQFVLYGLSVSHSFENSITHLTLGAACAGLVILLWEADTKK